jgi:hypothetical protein
MWDAAWMQGVGYRVLPIFIFLFLQKIELEN